jgi:hypothetical protein
MPTTAMRRNVFGEGRFHPDSMVWCGSGWRFAATLEANGADFGLARDLGLPISIHAGMAGFPSAVHELNDLGLLDDDVN